MGNCAPLPCPSPFPDPSFQDICANNNCHGCCIFHCSTPSVPAEAPPWDSPPVQTRQLPHLPPPQTAVSAANWAATEREIGGVARDVVPPAIGYRSWPSPWRAESGLVAMVATERGNSSGVAPPGVPGNGERPAPWLASSASAAETGVTGNGDRWSPPSLIIASGSAETRNRGQPAQPARRTESGLAETWTTTGRDAGAAATDMPLAAPPSVPRQHHGDRRAAPLSPRTESGSSAVTGATAGREDYVRCVARNPDQPVQPWTAGHHDAGAVAADMSLTVGVAVVSGENSSMCRDDSWSPAPSPAASRCRGSQGRLPSPLSSLTPAGQLSPAESRRRFPRASGAEDTY